MLILYVSVNDSEYILINLQYTRVKWDSQGTKKIGSTLRMSQSTESPCKWDFDKRGENVPLIKSF